MSAEAVGVERYPWKEIPGSSHQVLEERIAAMPEGLAVLDLGFGAGNLARRIRPRCAWLGGIELDAAAAAEGQSSFDRAFVGDLLEGLRSPWPRPFDVVVAGDVLEHLADPGAALAAVRALLKPGGTLLASLPNVANVTVRLALLAGRFSYAPRGILDETHLRFYTRATGTALLTRSGFRVARVTPTAMPFELAAPALGRPPLAPLVRGAAVGMSRLVPTLFGYQFVYEARPA